MVSKKILGVAIAAAFSSQAFAVVNLDLSSPTKPVIAKQSFATGDVTQVGGVDHYTVTNAANLLDIQSKMGVGMNNGQKLFVRVDLTNAVFGAAPALTAVGPATITGATIAQGGADASYVVFEVTNDASSNAQTDAVTIAAASYKLHNSFAGTSVKFTVYETLTAAVNNGTALYSPSTLANVITVGSGLKQTTVTSVATADVEKTFKFWTGALSTVLANVGKLTSSVDTATYAKNGTSLDAAEVFTDGSIKITGDFSLAGATYHLDTGDDCATAPVTIDVATDKKSASTQGAYTGLNGDLYLCVTVPAANSNAIPESAYTAEVKYDGIATASFAPAAFSAKVGDVVRNGTTIQVPYLTTFGEYNQRLVLVNRGGAEVAYTVTFTEEAGVTSTPGAAATGSLKANETKIIKSTDLVTLNGSSRTAATVAIVSSPSNIDAATTTVDLTDGVTDTVVLD